MRLWIASALRFAYERGTIKHVLDIVRSDPNDCLLLNQPGVLEVSPFSQQTCGHATGFCAARAARSSMRMQVSQYLLRLNARSDPCGVELGRREHIDDWPIGYWTYGATASRHS